VIGENEVRNAIRLGLAKADGYGFTQRGAVRFLVELMFMFGSHFDTDLQHPWVGDLLENRLLSDLFRADALHQQMTEYLDHVAGPNNVFVRSALVSTQRLAAHSTLASTSTKELVDELTTHLRGVYPQKCAWLGDERVRRVLSGGLESAEVRRVERIEGMALFAVLAFVLGHRCFDDPLYPWIAHTLRDSVVAPDQRAARLQRKALTYLDHVLLHLERN
jgi:hypothetical protein